MQVQLSPSADSAQAARVAVSEFLLRHGQDNLIDDLILITSELVANAIMHARTEMLMSIDLADTGPGARVTVTDGSDILPRWTPASLTATSGRGLLLVKQLSRSWGVEPLPQGGKSVWAEVIAPSVTADIATDELLELWSDEPWPAHPGATAVDVEVTVDIDVQAMLDSRAHTEDLIRDLQLAMLNANANAAETTPGFLEVERLARRLTSANNDFQEPRRQIYNQTIHAAKHQHTQTTLHLRLRRDDLAPARRWLEALDDADALTTAGILLLPPFPPHLTAFRRQYIAAITEQLGAAL